MEEPPEGERTVEKKIESEKFYFVYLVKVLRVICNISGDFAQFA